MIDFAESLKKVWLRNKIRKILENLLIKCKTQAEFEAKCRRLFPVESIRINWQNRKRFVEMVYEMNEEPVRASVEV